MKGVSKESLNFSYDNRGNDKPIIDLGNALGIWLILYTNNNQNSKYD